MKKLILTIALVLTACGTEGPAGPTGPTGPTGPAGSYTRGDIYCEAVTPASLFGTTDWIVGASCRNVADIPLDGSCQSTDLPDGVVPSDNRPVNWDLTDAGSPAGWFCGWETRTPSTQPSINGMAIMCCIAQ